MTDSVSFTRMQDGTQADYLLLREHEKSWWKMTADRLLRALAAQADETLGGYKITRLEHELQVATRATRDGADDDWIVGALLHDLGDGLAPQNHDRLAAEILRPFVREEVAWTVEHHGIFQMKFYAHHYEQNPNLRDRYRGHIYFDSCAGFCRRWDQVSFDPQYDSLPLEHFAPMVREIFARKAWDKAHIMPDVALGLP